MVKGVAVRSRSGARPAALTAERTSLLVLGMHRSGTSALTRLLNLVGYDLPDTLMEPDEAGNPLGFWESSEVKRFNDEILALAGTSWRRIEAITPERFADPDFAEPRARAAQLLIAEFGKSEEFVLKDPRLCRLLPFWLPVLGDIGADADIVSIVRNPIEVAASLRVMRGSGVNENYGEILWLRYVLDAEIAARGRSRAHITYDQLLGDWRDVVGRLGATFGRPLARMADARKAEIDGFLSSDHRHQRSDGDARSALRNEWVSTTFAIFERWARSGEDAGDYGALDGFREALDGASALLGEQLIFAVEEAIRDGKRIESRRRNESQLGEELSQEKAKGAELIRDAAAAQGAAREITLRYDRTLATAAAARGNLAQARARSATLAERIAVLDQRLADQTAGAILARTERDSERARSAEMAVSLRDRQARNKADAAALAKARELQARLESERETLTGEIARMRLDREAARAAAETERMRLAAEHDRAVAALTLDLERARADRHAAIAMREGERARLIEDYERSIRAITAELDRARADRDAAAREAEAVRIRLADDHARAGTVLDRVRADHLAALAAAGVADARIATLDGELRQLRSARIAAQENETADRARLVANFEEALARITAERDTALAVPGHRLLERLTRPFAKPPTSERVPDTPAAAPAADESDASHAEGDSHRAREIALIAASDLFDHAWYLRRYPDVAAADIDPIAHYLDAGARERRDPGPDFDTGAYLDRYPDIAEGDLNPLIHFILHGRDEGRSVDPAPAPVEPPKTGREDWPDEIVADVGTIEASGLFDAIWYLDRNADVRASGLDPARHYLTAGAIEGRDPGPGFDTSAYLDRYPDVREGGQNPLIHYILHGRPEGRIADTVEQAIETPVAMRLPSLEGWPDGTIAQVDTILASGLFDADWYLERNADVREGGIHPALHYLNDGAAERRDPGPAFSTAAYLARYPDIGAGGLNPLVHYILHGVAEGRDIGPLAPPPVETGIDQPASATTEDGRGMIDAIAAHPLFDADWYLERNPAASATGAAAHFHREGAAAGRDPGPDFDSVFYLRTNSDVRASAVPAFLHYIEHGEAEGRRTKPLVPRYEALLLPSRPILAAAMLIGETRLSPAQVMWADVGDGPDAVRFGGVALGERTTALADDANAALAIFARLHDWPLDGTAAPVGAGVSVLGGLFASERFRVADLWFHDDFDMRLRVDTPQGGLFADPARMRIYQADGDGLLLCGEGLAQGDGPLFVDIRTRNPFFPLLITAVSAAGALLGATVVPFPSLLGGGTHRGELVAQPSAGCRFEDVKRLSETLLIDFLGASAAPAIATIVVDPIGATGAERIFSAPVREWLADIAHVRVTLGGKDAPGFLAERLSATGAAPQELADSRARQGLVRLALPCDALPTVTALFGQRIALASADGTAIAFVVADPIDAGPSHLVILPPDATDGLDILQPAGSGLPMPWPTAIGGRARSKDTGGTGIAPVAIRYHRETPSDAGLLFRRAPDTIGPLLATAPATVRSITAIVAVPGFPERLPALLQSLAGQTIGDAIAVTLVVGPDAAAGASALQVAAERLFPGRHRIVPTESVNLDADLDAAAAGSDADYLLFADETVLLHDPRTVETLVALAQAQRVASAGCLHVHELRDKKHAVVIQSGGLFPERDAGLIERTAFGPFPRATYPSAGNSFRLALVGREVWREHGRCDIATGADRAAGFAVRTLAAGYRHLTTSAVSVSVLDRGALVSAAATADEGPAWQAALARAPQIRDVRS